MILEEEALHAGCRLMNVIGTLISIWMGVSMEIAQWPWSR